MSGDSAAYTAMAQQQARLQQAQRDRLARRRDAAQHRGGDDTNSEALGCPQCKATYAFGSSCLECDVLLVSASMMDQVAPQPATPPIDWLQQIFDMAMVTLITAAAAGLWFFYLYGG